MGATIKQRAADLTGAYKAFVSEIKQHPEGIAAAQVVKTLESRGLPEGEVQRAMHRALNRGAVNIGSKLRLYPAE
jgi:hypothetical protein